MDAFSLVSDPRSLYLTNTLQDTIKRVNYTIQKRQGLTCVLGDVGLGKTSLLRLIHWRQTDNPSTITALIQTPNFSTDFALLKRVCDEFGDVPTKRSLHEQQKALELWLVTKYEQGKNVVLFIDEAHKLKTKELELIRVLLNFESFDHKLIQIVLFGQLELKDKLLQKENKPLYSRVFAPSLIAPLTLEETAKVIEYRCSVEQSINPFTHQQIEEIYLKSAGVPREIIKQCAYLLEQDKPIDLESINTEGKEDGKEKHTTSTKNAKSKTRVSTRGNRSKGK